MRKINKTFDNQYKEVLKALVDMVAENYDLDDLTLKEVKKDGEVADEVEEWVRDNWRDYLSEDLVSYIDYRIEYYQLEEKATDSPYLMGSEFEVLRLLEMDVRAEFEKLVRNHKKHHKC